MKLKLNIKGKNYHIEILRKNKEGNFVAVKVNKEEFLFDDPKEKEGVLLAKTSLPKRNFSQKNIKAPIAGIISEIFVKEGELIKKNKKLVLLSAMKMENEIVSDFQGKVKKVLVKKGQKVAGHDILMIIE
jgi:biotin carboxyl carrier protein